MITMTMKSLLAAISAHTRSYGEDIACAIDEEVKRMIEEAHHDKAHEP